MKGSMKTKGALGAALCALVMTMTACNVNDRAAATPGAGNEAASTPATAVPPSDAAAPVDALASPLASPLESPLTDAMQIGLAGIDRVTLRVEPGKAQQVMAKVNGYLGDACTSLGAVTQAREGEVIRVSVGTLRPRDRMCAQVVKDFEIDVAVDVTGFAVGAYTVDVNGVQAKFEVDAGGPIVR